MSRYCWSNQKVELGNWTPWISSGTAVILQNVIQKAGGPELKITSTRQGEVVGIHELTLDSLNDTITLRHDAKSRRGFADGAVRAAEWLKGKTGFYDFKDVWREL